jgi:hypothetical protein
VDDLPGFKIGFLNYGAGVPATLTAGVGTGVTVGAEFGATGATVGTGGAEMAGTLFMIGAGVETGALGNLSLSGTLPGCTPGVGLAVCAETNDSVIRQDATIVKYLILFI